MDRLYLNPDSETISSGGRVGTRGCKFIPDFMWQVNFELPCDCAGIIGFLPEGATQRAENTHSLVCFPLASLVEGRGPFVGLLPVTWDHLETLCLSTGQVRWLVSCQGGTASATGLSNGFIYSSQLLLFMK